MATDPVIIATRGSELALAQARAIQQQCQKAFPERHFELRIVKTTGDKLQTASLASLNLPKGLFTKELEQALLSREAGLAVHSLKDLPTELPPGLALGGVTRREDVRDVLIARRCMRLADLPKGATVATSSTRRQAFLLDSRPDLKIVPIRGNVPTRLKRFSEKPELDGLVLAAAGLIRLGYDFQEINAVPLSFDEMLPCVGQAAIGIEIRTDDQDMAAICAKLNDPVTFACVTAERAFLKGMGGGCQMPVAAYAEARGDQLHLRAVSFFSKPARRGELTGPLNDPESLGRRLASQLS
jgi:hydroxymethylbilane synthase